MRVRHAPGRRTPRAARGVDSGLPHAAVEAREQGARRLGRAQARKGSKVHAAVDPLGHLLTLLVTPSNEQDRAQVDELAATVLEATGETVELAYADQGYTGEQPAADAAAHGIQLAVVKLSEAKWWVIERDFAWTSRFRRLARDYECLLQVLARLHFIAFAYLMLHRLIPVLLVRNSLYKPSGLVDILRQSQLEREPPTESVEVEGDAKQQRLPLLRAGRASGRACRESGLGGREVGRDQRPLAIALSRGIGPHLRPYATQMLRSLAALGGDDAVRADDLADDGVVQFAVELAVRQDEAHRGEVAHALEQRAHGGAVVGWPGLGDVCQDQPAEQVDHDHPLKPVSPGQPLATVSGPVDEEGADGAGREARPVDGHRRPLGWGGGI